MKSCQGISLNILWSSLTKLTQWLISASAPMIAFFLRFKDRSSNFKVAYARRA